MEVSAPIIVSVLPTACPLLRKGQQLTELEVPSDPTTVSP